MKFQRGRKKNKIIWSCSLKNIASQSGVKLLFFIKSENRKRFGPNTFSETEDVLP